MKAPKMIESCKHCHRKPAGEAKEISFLYEGAEVTVFKNGLICKDCLIEKWKEGFKAHTQTFVSVSEAGFQVDWAAYFQFISEYPTKGSLVNDFLQEIGVLSRRAQGNWELVTSDATNLNPRAYLILLYFVRKEDAIEFARTQYGDSVYSWKIHRVSEVITKKEVMEEVELPLPV